MNETLCYSGVEHNPCMVTRIYHTIITCTFHTQKHFNETWHVWRRNPKIHWVWASGLCTASSNEMSMKERTDDKPSNVRIESEWREGLERGGVEEERCNDGNSWFQGKEKEERHKKFEDGLFSNVALNYHFTRLIDYLITCMIYNSIAHPPHHLQN